jgi:hypothetical protein
MRHDGHNADQSGSLVARALGLAVDVWIGALMLIPTGGAPLVRSLEAEFDD